MSIKLRLASVADADLLAQMNQQLIIDEDSRNPMSLTELKNRMVAWLQSDWSVVLAMKDDTAVGYMLFQKRRDEYFPEKVAVYVRQFFVSRQYRRRGIGRSTFEKIVAHFFPPSATITLDILESNQQGRSFWEGIGFQPYSTTMVRQQPQATYGKTSASNQAV